MRAILYCLCAAIQILAAATWLYLSMMLPSRVNAQSGPAEDTSIGCTSSTRAIVLKVPMLASGIVLNPAFIACPCSATRPYHVSRTAVMSATLLQRAFQWPQWLVNLLWLLTCANQLSAQACSYICQAVVASMWIYATSVMGTQCKWTYTNPLSQAVQAAINLEVPSMLTLAALQCLWQWPTWITYALWLVSELSKPRTKHIRAQPPPHPFNSSSHVTSQQKPRKSILASAAPVHSPVVWCEPHVQPQLLISRQSRTGCTAEKATRHRTASFTSEASVILCIKAAITCAKATISCIPAAVTATAPKLLQLMPDWLLFPPSLDDAVVSFCQSPACWFSWFVPLGKLLVQVTAVRWIGDNTKLLSNSAAAMQQGSNAVHHAASVDSLQHQHSAPRHVGNRTAVVENRPRAVSRLLETKSSPSGQLRPAAHARPAATAMKQRPGAVSMGSHMQTDAGSQPSQLHLAPTHSPVSGQGCSQVVQLPDPHADSDVSWEAEPDLSSNNEAQRSVYNIGASCQVVPGEISGSTSHKPGQTIQARAAALKSGHSPSKRHATASRQASLGRSLAGNSQQSAHRLKTAQKLRKLVSFGLWRKESICKRGSVLVQNQCNVDAGEARDASSQHMPQPKLSAVQKLRRRLSSGGWRVSNGNNTTMQSSAGVSHDPADALHVLDTADNGSHGHEQQQRVQQSTVAETEAVEGGRRAINTEVSMGRQVSSGRSASPGSVGIDAGRNSKQHGVQQQSTGRLTAAQKLRRRLSSSRWTGL